MSEGRPLAPFGRREVPVTGVRSHGAYTVVQVEDRAAPVALPGQFHMLAAAEGWGAGEDGRPWLPRAISFLHGDGAGRFDFLIDPVGPGTRLLCSLDVGDTLLLAGPFGNGFQPIPEGDRPVLVGGGIGAAPVMAAAEWLSAQGREFDLLLGFRSSAHAAVADLAPTATVVTDDGTAGRSGTVLGPLGEVLTDRTGILACGPPAMLEAVRALAREHGLASQLALESAMACGFGACFGCAVETREGTIRLCVDGPVLRGEDLDRVTETGRVGTP